MNFSPRQKFFSFVLAGYALLTLSAQAGNPLWNGSGSVTNNNFSNTNNWVAGNVPVGNSINNLPVNFGPLASGATNRANCDATGNPQTWTFNVGTAPMVIIVSNEQLGAAGGPDVFLNNSANLQTITGDFRIFDINGTTTTRRFNAAAGPLAIAAGTISFRGDSAPTVWGLELSGSVAGSFINCGFANVNAATVNLVKSGTGTWEIFQALPNLAGTTTNFVTAGTLTLDGANTYTGPTIVASGATLNTVTISTGAGAYSVSNAATFGVTLASAGTSLTNSSLTLGATGTDATILNFNLGGFGNPAKPLISVAGALTLNGTCTINLTNGSLSAGQFPLIKYGSQSGAGGFVLGTLPGSTVAVLSNNVAGNSLDLVVFPVSIYWNGNVSAAWDINATANWQSNGVVGLVYADAVPVTFNDSAAGNFSVTLDTIVRPASVTVNNSATNYSISGAGGIIGSNSLTKLGSGVFTLGTTNNYTGSTTVGGGALVLNTLNALPSGNILSIINGAVVQPKLAGTFASVATTLNGSSGVNGSFGGALDFHSGGATTATWPGPINLNAANATIGSYGVTYNVTLSGQLTGSGGLTIRTEGGSAASHTATFTLSNPSNNYMGSTTVQVGTAQLSATLKLGASNALPATTTLNLNRVGSSGAAYLDLAGFSQTVSGLTGNFISNAVINSSGTLATFTVSNATASTFGGFIGSAGKANITLIKKGAGALPLSGANIFTGATTISAGTLALNGIITATTGLSLSNNATLQLTLGPTVNVTNIVVNGNANLAGAISLNDAGIVSNTPYPVVYYSGTLATNGLTVSPVSGWNFTVDTSVPHLLRLIPTQQFPFVEITNGNFAVTSLTTNLIATTRGSTTNIMWYEVRSNSPAGFMTDFGAHVSSTPWPFTVRHLKGGTNWVTVFARDNSGMTYSNSVALVLDLSSNPPVRPRPIPAEIWWGGLSTNQQLIDPTKPWDFVKKFEDGIFFHSAGYGGLTSSDKQALASQMRPYNTKYWVELGGGMSTTPGDAFVQYQAVNGWGAHLTSQQNLGLVMSQITHDYHMENMQDVCQVNPTWPTNNQIAWWTGDMSITNGSYPYASGMWRDIFNIYYTNNPHLKVGQTSQPEYWPWDNNPVEAPLHNDLSFNVTNALGQNIPFSFNAHDIWGSFVNMASAIGHPYFSLQSDAPWEYFGGLVVGTAATEARMRLKIRVYEQYLQSRNTRHSLICNASSAASQPGGPDAQDNYFKSGSLNSMFLHQQEGGRANVYLFESWYFNIPNTAAPETKAGSYANLAMDAIKYLKGIADTNGALEGLSLTLLNGGATNTIQLRNDGDLTCLPAVTAADSGGSGTVAYYDAAGSNITTAILSAEGYVYTNRLAPGATTTIRIVPSVQPLNRAITLESFWNPQDPTGVVRSRLVVTQSNTPPVLATNANRTIIAGATLTVTNAATDTNLPVQTLTFSLLTAPTNAAINATNGIFSWRPTIAQSPTTNLISVTVADNGSPVMSATQSFSVFVLRPATPAMSSAQISGGVFSLLVNGNSGPDYILQAATNLNSPISWLPLQTNLSAAPPFTFTDFGATNSAQKFYRLQLGP